MDDSNIIALYFARSERAITETDIKYGRLCRYIAVNILANIEDSEECVNDTYLGVWNSVPPQKPCRFSAFVGKVTRNLALKKYEYCTAAKRNPNVALSFSELAECVSGRESVELELENKHIETTISDFLERQEEEKRIIFIRRYWYFEPIAEISRHCGFSESKVTSMLHYMRKKLREHLEKEGIEL